ncbi:MAG: hypothetical protein K1060chlam1_00239 [Candidatus Anoxychlamydiales bacterium]|nr:hypothetical protein [Candidatus Anoxychlamydiales bacterium]
MKNSFIFLFLFLTSCGYHLGRSQNYQNAEISVPYIEKDLSGYFSQELIKQISYSSNLNYKYSNADYTLCVKIIDSNTSQIGYKYDRNNENVRQNNLRATEGRQKITARVELIDKNSNCTKFGPFDISANADFDYVDPDSLNDLSFIDPNGNRTTVLAFSLGQLESIESAKEAASKPLYEKLAKKIVDAISAYW